MKKRWESREGEYRGKRGKRPTQGKKARQKAEKKYSRGQQTLGKIETRPDKGERKRRGK